VALFMASSTALLVNYAGMRVLVFTTPAQEEGRPFRRESCEKMAPR
jgi:hypothetical protein